MPSAATTSAGFSTPSSPNRKEKLTFYGLGNRVCKTEYWIIPERWLGAGIMEGRDTSHMDGAGGYLDAKRKSETFVAYFGANSGWYKNTGRGATYTGDVQAFGITLKAQSSYSTNLDLRYSFGAMTVEPHILFAPDAPVREAKTVYAY